MKPEDFKDPMDLPKERFTADNIQSFRDVGKSQIPKVVLGLGSVAQTGFLLRGNELPDGTLVPTADETEINAMREIFNSLRSALANPSMADTPDTHSTGTGFYL